MSKFYLMDDESILGETEHPDVARQLYDVAFHIGFHTLGNYNIALIKWSSCKDIQTIFSADFVDGKLVSYQN